MRVSDIIWKEWKALYCRGDINEIVDRTGMDRRYVGIAIKDGCGDEKILREVGKYYQQKSMNQQEIININSPF